MTVSDPLLAMLTKAEVAQLLRCSERTIERQVRDGEFPPPHRLGRESLWFQSVVQAWLERRLAAQQGWLESPKPVGDHSAGTLGKPTGRAKRARAKPPVAGAVVQSVFSAKQLSEMRG